MNGMERLTDAAARHGWERQEERSGYSSVVYWHRKTTEGLQTVEVYRRTDGGVTYGHRTWGSRTRASAPKVADQVLTWMQEPTPDDGTDRGFFFRLATSHGWTFKGIDSGDVYTWSAHRITLRFRTHQSVLGDAQRNFGGPGEVRSIHTNVPANITPWFHAFMDREYSGYDCGCTGLAQSLEPGEVPTTADVMGDLFDAGAFQEPAKPVVRPASPSTPDRKLQRLAEELEQAARSIRESLEPFSRDGRSNPFAVDELEEVGNRLARLSRDAEHASQEATYLMLERHPQGGANLVRLLREKEENDRG